MFRFAFGLVAAVLVLSGAMVQAAPVQAAAPTKIEWKDLVPQKGVPKNPLDILTIEQSLEFDNIVWARNPEPGDTEEDRKEAEDAGKKSTILLRKQGIDVDRLYDDYQKWKTALETMNETLVETYNRKKISMAGYLLPLDFDEKGSTEFLLVPFIGACIHVPPPPINQTVFVHSKKRFLTEDLYAPVWVTGSMRAKRLSKALTLTDGTSDISAGYSVSDAAIVQYKEEEGK